ncbi:hypothetical protein QFC22_006350 [Naganishia vaughanmartiniae]|uniref:Uncharacterized protein n=1 Tax=Naganishia vaughanmartiniae TaxID=1424756 RepID=A0ACC2WKV7_9TREE|nr:hypothetical protein QFC22_006350 [Naganishia vaughanmartiniae]
MSDPRSRVLPPPPPIVEDAAEVASPSVPTTARPLPKSLKSIKDFFGGKGQIPAVAPEQDLESARTPASHEVTSDRDEAGKKMIEGEDDEALDADTSINSVVLVEPTGNKRKAMAAAQGKSTTSTSGKKRAQSKKITDEDAEMKEMAAAAKKKQKLAAKAAPKKSKIVSVEGPQEGLPSTLNGTTSDIQPANLPKKRVRPKKRVPTVPAPEIIDISSPTKRKQPSSLQAKKRGGHSKITSGLQSAEELDLTNTEGEDEFEVVEHSQSGSQSSALRTKKSRSRLMGSASAGSSTPLRQIDTISLVDDDSPMDVDLPAVSAVTKVKVANPSTAGKPLHSFFSKPKAPLPVPDATPLSSGLLSQGSRGSAKTIEGIEDGPVDPSRETTTKTVLATDFQNAQALPASTSVKPVHGLFSMKPKKPLVTSNPAAPTETTDTVNPFFTPPARLTIGKPGWSTHVTTVKDAPWPRAEETCRREEIEMPRLDLPKRSRQRIAVDSEEHGFWTKMMPRASVDLTIDEPVVPAHVSVTSIPEEYAQHPAVISLPLKAANGTQTQLWNDKYRPLNHSEVLGNEIPAKYLVDWLNELAIGINGEQSDDRRKVQRKVVKTRAKQQKEDDWIVEDDEPIRDDRPDDASYIGEAHSAQQEIQQKGYPDLRNRLTNSILLQGPYGSGKTASVYAAAAELGWEVFEVYPGIGKRSGAHLQQLVGDVGKNHMVGKGKQTVPASPAPEKPKPNPLFQAFAKAASKDKASSAVDVESQYMDLTASPARKTQMDADFGFVAQPCDTNDPKAGGPDVRQSLILLEEVDILYEEDKGFWPAVVSLIEDSKRPVIMTCNDLTMIPFEELALQTTLLFSPPEPVAARALLTGIAAAERSTISGDYLDDLMQACQLQGMDGIVLSEPVIPPPGRWSMGVDLRAAMCQLQLDVPPGFATRLETCRVLHPHQRILPNVSLSSSESEVKQDLQDLRLVGRMADMVSSTDAGIARKVASFLELDEPDTYKPSEDDEVGFHALFKPLSLQERQILPTLSKEDEIEETIKGLAATMAGTYDWLKDSFMQDLAIARQRYQEATLAFLDPMIPLDSHLLPNPILFLDIIPAISVMTHIDDALQAADLADAAAGRKRVNRRTGREMRITSYFSGNQAYIRQMSGALEESELQAIRDCRLDLAQFDRTLA